MERSFRLENVCSLKARDMRPFQYCLPIRSYAEETSRLKNFILLSPQCSLDAAKRPPSTPELSLPESSNSLACMPQARLRIRPQ